jgi:hypothetical protein
MDPLVSNVVFMARNENGLPRDDWFVQSDHFGDGLYTGQVGLLNGLHVRQGYGRMEFKEGDWYQGNWDSDTMSGEGCFYYKTKNNGYKGVFMLNCAVNGTFYFNSLDNEMSRQQPPVLSIRKHEFWQIMDKVHAAYLTKIAKQIPANPQALKSQRENITTLLAKLQILENL